MLQVHALAAKPVKIIKLCISPGMSGKDVGIFNFVERGVEVCIIGFRLLILVVCMIKHNVQCSCLALSRSKVIVCGECLGMFLKFLNS